MSIEKAVKFIKAHDNFLVLTHANVEGDALGSQLSFYRLLKALGKQATMVNDEQVPSGYRFLPGIQRIRRYSRAGAAMNFAAAVALDCSDLKRTGEVHTLIRQETPILNIDHHISNALFATVNWVDAHAASCTQMIYVLFKKMGVALDAETALLLYVGIMTDTGSFRYSNTSRATHGVVSELLRFPLDIPSIYKNIYENIPFNDMRLLSRILPAVRLKFQGRLAWCQIKKAALKRQQESSFDLSEHVLTFLRAIQGMEVAALFKENLKTPHEVRVNFRSQGKVDVNEIARSFGGGGHKTASGCTVKGELKDVQRRVFKRIGEALQKSI